MKLSLETIFGLVIGVIFVIIIGFVIVSLIKLYLPQEIDEATMSSFEEIVRVVKQIESGEVESKKIVVDIKEPFMINSFDKGVDLIEGIQNPCTKTCLCICNADAKPVKNFCLKYKDKCVEFDDIPAIRHRTIKKPYLRLSYSFEPYSLELSKTKEGIIIM